MKRLSLVILPLLFLAISSHAPAASPDESPAFQVGEIYYFGYQGLDLKKLQANLPVHIGDTVYPERRGFEWQAIRDTVKQVTGSAPTNIERVCCDESHNLILYIGLCGTSSHPFPSASPPRGSDHLEEAALKLYDQQETAMVEAVRRGASGEDDSKGYAISKDPATRQIDLAVRAYAAHRGPELEKVLRNAADPQQRRVSAWLLGYADRSTAQIQSLAKAASDADSEVRNNAVRALGVLASDRNAGPVGIAPGPFISLLFSGQWSDRNKGSLLLEKLTRQRDPALLAELRDKAFQPLIEGAGWDPGHAGFFLLILGRIANLPEDRLRKLVDAHDTDQIIQTAEHTPATAKLP